MIAPRDADPRQDGEADVRPTVALPRQGLPNWLIAAGIVAFALLLFAVLEARRRAASAPTAAMGADDAVRTATAAPPLYVPPTAIVAPAVPVAAPSPVPTPAPPPPAPPPPPQIVYVPQPAPVARAPDRPARPVADDRSSALVYDSSTPEPVAPAGATGAAPGTTDVATAIPATARARRLSNRATTVAQGTSIPAVLESALDSTRAGPARALVSRDVRSADGSRILIPRGSRLFGDYRADVQAGQNRVLVTWTRLVRPDGASVAIASPAADPLGRVGVRGKVNTHFWSRFGTALLQSALNVGVNLASRQTDSQVVVALPGAAAGFAGGGVTSGGALLGTGQQAAPTIRVRQGTSITVFVARDLDFTGVQDR